MEDQTFRFKIAPLSNQDKLGHKGKADSDATKTETEIPTQVPIQDSSTTVNLLDQPVDRPKPRVSDPSTSKATTQIAEGTVQSPRSELPTQTTRVSKSKKQKQKQPEAFPNGGRLGPYELIKLLGQGGMGAVFLARQTTLDRNVALKVVRSKLSKNPSMLARFTREAYAAAQLVHPNVVQIYDMGDDNGSCFFSMELINGSSLLDYVNEKKKVDPDQATSFILQAARGLRCAHDAGMVHRDIKPANLLVDQNGIVKVADLGLVKVPDVEEIEDEVRQTAALSASQDLTRYGAALGTPYYMAPEQAKNAIEIDHRADIYSLGCSFYVLLTGKRPFEGNSVEEVVSKHNSAPLVMPSTIVQRVPPQLSAIVAKMMAKKPEDRFQSMDSLIEVLEGHLGITSAESFTPTELDADEIESSAKGFYASHLIKIRPLLPMALGLGSLLLAVITAFVNWKLATSFLVMPLFAVASYFALSGILGESYLFEKSKELFLRSGWVSWIKWSLGGLIGIGVTFLMGTMVYWIVFAIIGFGLATAAYFFIDKKIEASRIASLKSAGQIVRRMRLKGMDESTIQMFVAKYCGNHWEEFFEKLFGYENKRKIRNEIKRLGWGDKKPVFRKWRDSVADKLQARLGEFVSEDSQKHLQKIEQAGLEAQGLSPDEAREQASQMAAALVDHGVSIRDQATIADRVENDPALKALQKRMKIKSMLAEARSGKYRKKQTSMQKLEPYLNFAGGSFVRFLLGSILVLGCLFWARQNNLFSVSQLANSAQSVLNAEDTGQVAQQQLADFAARETTPLSFPIVGNLFYNFNPLIAGLLLIFSTVSLGWRMSIFAIPAALVIVLGELLGIPDVESFPLIHSLTAVFGVGIFMAGIFFGKSS
ncbi:MAG: serine/threonine-protein kinase [Planctomycetota bacterium]